MSSPVVIAITGGIGSGKSVVSRVVEAMGYDVYDCDREAKTLMDCSDGIKHNIARLIAPECVREGVIDRPTVARIVFADKAKLDTLNSIVHSAVREHLTAWIGVRSGRKVCFVETAILYQSGLDRMVDEVWIVDAPAEIRTVRVMGRNGLSREEVEARIKSQDSYVPDRKHNVRHIINNDGDAPVLPRVERLLEKI